MVTLLKCRSELASDRVLLKIRKDVGPIVKIETSSRDNLSIKVGAVESESNTNVKFGWVYIYCEKKDERMD